MDLSESVATAADSAVGSIHCVECSTTSTVATIYCKNCPDYFCGPCFTKIHANGYRQSHHHSVPVELSKCSECAVMVSTVRCNECGDFFCFNCFDIYHCRGGRRHHLPIIIPSLQHTRIPDHSATSVKTRLDKMKSPWIALSDSCTVTYYNVLKNFEPHRDVYGVINNLYYM